MQTQTDTTAGTDHLTIDGAITEVKKPDNALVIVNPTQFATELFQPYNDQLAVAKRKAGREKYDIKTKDGMAKAKEFRATFVTIRTTADKAKSEAKRPIDEAGKKILEIYKALETAAKAEEAKHNALIVAEETRIEEEKQARIAAERVRIEAIEARIAHIAAIPVQLAPAESGVIAAKIEELVAKRLDPAMYDEFLEAAVTAINTTVDQLREHHATALTREAAERQAAADRAELARLQEEKKEREKKEAADAERRAEEDRQRQLDAEKAAQATADALAAVQRQQAQMGELMEIQQLSLTDPQDRAALEAALAKATAFNPASYGALEPMAKMTRDTSTATLNALLAALPAPEPEPAVEVAAPAVEAAQPAVVETAPVSAPRYRSVLEPVAAPAGPTDLELVKALAELFVVPTLKMVDRLATIDFAELRKLVAGE